MPIKNIKIYDKYNGAELTTGWGWCSFSSFDWNKKEARLVYEIFTSKAAAYGGKLPIEIVEYILKPHETPAEITFVLVSEGVPAVYSEPDPETGESELITPAVDPVYETVILRNSLPSLPQLVQDNIEAYNALLATVDGVVLNQPEFTDAEIE